MKRDGWGVAYLGVLDREREEKRGRGMIEFSTEKLICKRLQESYDMFSACKFLSFFNSNMMSVCLFV